MPFKVTYSIYSVGKAAPFFNTTDKRLATVEFHEQQRTKGNLNVRMVPEIIPQDLTKPEEYVWLVYRVLKAIRKYYDERNRVPKEQSDDNLKVSLALESELDKWNARTRFYLQGHPKSRPDDEKAFAFFQVVEEWRSLWKKYFAYKRLKDKDPNVEREMKKQCFDFEKAIDDYINKAIGI